MFKKFTLTFLAVTIVLLGSAQVNLKPSIGIGDLPANGDQICDIPLFLDSFDESGYVVGDTVPDFNLYDVDGNEFVLSDALAEGKPVLMVAGSYTCFVFRHKVDEINELIELYGDELTIVVVYGVEAHPVNDISPYFGFENVGNANIIENVLHEQPKTYGQRKALVSLMLNEMDIDAPVYLDGPCNNWWANYGPAPNNAYLIGTDGTVLIKQPWFDKAPNDIFCTLHDVIGLGEPCVQDLSGSFTFSLQSDSVASGEAGTTISSYGLLENDSDSGVQIEIFRLVENLPFGWATSLCTDVCYPAEVTYATATLEAGETLVYTNYFYTDEIPNKEGIVEIGFRNANNFSNQFKQSFIAMTTEPTNASEVGSANNDLSVFPNPSHDLSWVRFPEGWQGQYASLEVVIEDLQGRSISRQTVHSDQAEIRADQVTPGMYIIRLFGDGALLATAKWLVQ